jgi:serine/threonine-protein kinase HipA
MNPNEMGNGLTLNISENSNEQDLSLALATAKHYQLKTETANRILNEMQKELAQWQEAAKKNGINKAEIEQTKMAFRLIA